VHLADGALTITRTTISSNTSGAGNGGGVFIAKGTHTIEASTIFGNRTGDGVEFGGAGGGVFIDGGSRTLRNATGTRSSREISPARVIRTSRTAGAS
jgi:hypothetical protein